VTHTLESFAAAAHRIISMRDGRIEGGALADHEPSSAAGAVPTP